MANGLSLSFVLQAYEKEKTMPMVRTDGELPARSVVRVQEEIDDFDRIEVVNLTFKEFPPLAFSEQARGNTKVLHKVVCKFWDEVFITYLQGSSNANLSETTIELCETLIPVIYSICLKCMTACEKVQLPDLNQKRITYEGPKAKSQYIEFQREFQIANRQKNMAVRKCALNIFFVARSFYKEKWFHLLEKVLGARVRSRDADALEQEARDIYNLEEMELRKLMK